MALKSDAKLKEKLTCGFKYDMTNLVNFHPTTQKSKNFTPMGYFCQASIWGLSCKNTEKLSFMKLNSDTKFEKPWPCGFKNGIKIGWTFIITAPKSLKNCTLMGSFCPKHIMFQLETFRVIMCHNTKGCCKV